MSTDKEEGVRQDHLGASEPEENGLGELVKRCAVGLDATIVTILLVVAIGLVVWIS